MTAKTESQHAGAFIGDELDNGLSRDTGTVASGQVLVDGQAIMKNGSDKIVAADGSGTSGDLDGTVCGIVIGAWDATSGDIANVPFIHNNATYKSSLVTKNAETTESSSITTALKALFIRAL